MRTARTARASWAAFAGPALAALLAAGAAAGDFGASARGTTGAEFLNLGVGGRAMAMGGAAAAAADDASAVYWNPAAMTNVERRSITAMHAAYLASTSLDYLGYVHNAEKYGYAGIAFQYFSAGKLNQTDETGNNLGSVFPYDMALYFSYARKVGGDSALAGYSFGATAKLIDSQIQESASAGALDLGVLSRPYWDGRLRWAFTAVNLGGDSLIYDQVHEKLPIALRAAAALRLSQAWLLTADLVAPRSDHPYLAAGTEYWLASGDGWRLAARAGVNSQTMGSVDGITGLSMGFGLAYGRGSFDYALVPYGGLGQAHRLSFSYAF